jgi:hypothetical protein
MIENIKQIVSEVLSGERLIYFTRDRRWWVRLHHHQ